MNISIHPCRKPQVRARGLKIALTLLYAFVLYSETVVATPNNYTDKTHLTSIINFQFITRCPPIDRSTPNSNNDGNSCLEIPKSHLIQHYAPYNSIFRQQQLRPFSFRQQIAMLELFDELGITEHNYNLRTMVNLTQYKNLPELTAKQLAQAREWREFEGSVIQEKTCRDDSLCKEKVSSALFKMGMYDHQIPPLQHYDYTLFLGGSIQQMQQRMIMMLSLFDSSLKHRKLDLGEIIMLSCNRLVDDREADERPSITMFDVSRDPINDLAKAYIDDYQEVFLTETTSYQALTYSLKKMSQSLEHFERFRETSNGYHPTLPVDFLAPDSFEIKLYRKLGYTYQLDVRLPKLLRKFFKRYPDTEIVETPIQKIGEMIKRPTTKQTVKKWLKKRNNKLSCKDPKHCRILAISNAPNTIYQHVAVLQALEESITTPTNLIYEITTAGSAASLNIPTNTLLDNLSKILYLEAVHPEN